MMLDVAVIENIALNQYLSVRNKKKDEKIQKLIEHVENIKRTWDENTINLRRPANVLFKGGKFYKPKYNV